MQLPEFTNATVICGKCKRKMTTKTTVLDLREIMYDTIRKEFRGWYAALCFKDRFCLLTHRFRFSEKQLTKKR